MTDNTTGAYITADDFFDSRREWIEVYTVEVEPNAFDIMVKIDGTYFDRETACEVAELFVHDLRHLLANLDPKRCIAEADNQ